MVRKKLQKDESVVSSNSSQLLPTSRTAPSQKPKFSPQQADTHDLQEQIRLLQEELWLYKSQAKHKFTPLDHGKLGLDEKNRSEGERDEEFGEPISFREHQVDELHL